MGGAPSTPPNVEPFDETSARQQLRAGRWGFAHVSPCGAFSEGDVALHRHRPSVEYMPTPNRPRRGLHDDSPPPIQ